jgi:hypothetical protein
MKISPVRAQFFLAYRWTDVRTDWQDEVNFVFGNFANSPKKPFRLHQRIRLVDRPCKYEVPKKPVSKIGWMVAMAVVVVLDLLQYLWYTHLMFKNLLAPAVQAPFCEAYLIYTAYPDSSTVVHYTSITRQTRLFGRFSHVVYYLKYRPTYDFTLPKNIFSCVLLNHYGNKRNSVGNIIPGWFEKVWPSKLLERSSVRVYLPKIWNC